MSFEQYSNKKKKKYSSFSEYSDSKHTAIAPTNLVSAPIREETEDNTDRKWFQKGGLEDGFSFENLHKTISSTARDFMGDIYGGMAGIVEGTIDTGAYIIGGAGGLFGADDLQDKMQKFIAKDIIDEDKVGDTLAYINGGVLNDVAQKIMFGDSVGYEEKEEYSLLGDRADSLSQSAGQLVGQIGLQAVGVPWFVTSGVTSFGGEAENAFNQGATYGEAGLSGAISAGAEILSEKLSGGIKFGGKTLDDLWLKPLTEKISSKTARTLVNLGLDAVGEGAEEIFSSVFSRLGSALYKEESIDELLTSEEAMDEYLEGFIGGAVLGGGMGGVNAATSAKTGRDYKTGLTENEQSVVDKVYNDLVEKAEKSGEKLTTKEKNELKEQVIERLKKGDISTDTIESVLGGDTFKSYQDTVDSEDAILKEFEELGKKQNPTLADQSRYAELKEQVKEIQNNSQRNTLKTQLSEEVQKLLVRNNGKTVQADNYLIESYNERAKRGQAFEADLSQYDEKYKTTVQKAIDSGILNNTRRTHEFVDMIAKISADKGVLFDFTNNAKLKDSGFAVDGKSVNGYVTKDGITVNIDSHKSLNSVVGHEITHVLEGTEIYTELQNALFEYAKTKGDYQGRLDTLTKLYEGVEGADTAAELTADLVGDYLFTDADFINNLSTKHRNVFQKIYDEIKYMLKVATAGSKEARELEKVKRAFDKAYKESGKANTEVKAEDIAEADTKYSISVTDKKTIDFLENQEHITTYKAMQLIDGKLYPPMAAKVKGEDGKYRLNNPSELGKWQQATEDPTNIKKVKNGVGYYTLNKGNGKSIDAAYNPYEHSSNLVLNDQFEEAYNRDNIVTVECEIPVSEMTSGYKAEYAKDGTGVMDWKSGVVAGKIKDNKRKVYLSRYLKPVRILSDAETAKMYKDVVGDVSVPFNVVTPNLLTELEKVGVNIDYDGSPMYKSIQRRKAAKGETKYSLSDSDGKQLTMEQSEYFKDSKMRDENGNLKVMYHGSQDAGFHTFDANMSDDDTSFFFVDRNDVAASYSGTTETYEAQTIHTAEDMNNFIESIGVEGYEVVEKDGKFTLLYEGDRVADSKTAQGIYDEFCWYEGVGEGDANYKVYLNLTNPLVVDADGRNWNNVTREYSQEIADKYKSLTAEEKAALIDLADWDEIDIFRDAFNKALVDSESGFYSDENAKTLARAFKKLGSYDANVYDIFSVASENFSEDSIKEFAVKQMNTRDYAQKAKAEGYDGVIFNNIVDVGGYGNGSEGAATVAIAFDSNQIKSVANEKPTSDPDIRFSLSKAVEETKDLMALHNLKSEELIKSLNLGGLPMPSIAIIKAEAGHEQYGDISLIIPKESIDPKANRDNKVYGGDAWTPTYPRIEFKANEAVEKKIHDKYYELSRKHGTEELRSLYTYTYDMEDTLNRHGGESAMLEDLYKSTGLMQVYLLDIGKGKIDPIRKEIKTELSDAEVEMDEFFIKELGEDVVDGVMNLGILSPSEHRIKYWGEHGESIKEAYKKFLSEEYSFSQEEIENVISSMKTYDYMKIVRDAHLYRKNGRVTTKTEIDHTATENAIREAAGDGFKDWIDGLFAGVEEKSGIRNNVDYFTSNGNRRKWEALHWENTLENVVRVMKQQNQTGADAIFGAHQIFATSAKNYKSIDEIKADSDRLYKMSDDEYESIKESYSQRMLDIATRIMDKGERNQFIAIDNAMECIVDAVRTSKTAAGISRELKQYSQLNVTEKDVNDIVSLVTDISNMPTGYFEAKPQRAVGFDEIGVFVIPNNADVKLKQELLNRGYSIAEYDPNVEGDRQKVVNSFEEYKFSLSNANETPKSYGNFNISGEDVRLEAAPIQEEVAPVNETTSSEMEQVADSIPDNIPTLTEEETKALMGGEPNLYDLEIEAKSLEEQISKALDSKDAETVNRLLPQYTDLQKKIKQMQTEENALNSERIASLDEADIPPEVEAPYYEEETVMPDNPFEDRDIKEVGNRKVKAYMYENPEVKPFFQKEANIMLGELANTTKGERWYNDEVYYESGGEYGWSGTQRHTTEDIAYLLDNLRYSYADIEKGLRAIIEDNGAENNACSKRIEFLLNDRLMKGYVDDGGYEVPPDQDYIKLLNEKQIIEYGEEAKKRFFEVADDYAPYVEGEKKTVKATAEPTVNEDIAPIFDTKRNGEVDGQQTLFEDETEPPKVAKVLTEEPETPKKKRSIFNRIMTNIADKGFVFENLAKKTKNRELESKYNFMHYSEARAQEYIADHLKPIVDKVEKLGKTEQLYEYVYHLHNIDRMSLETEENRVKRETLRDQFKGYSDKQIEAIAMEWIKRNTPEDAAKRIKAAREYIDTLKGKNKPVFGDTVTADVSREAVKKLETENPELKELSKAIIEYNAELRKMLVDGNVISQETADLWAKMYPHYVPVRRLGDEGLSVNVPLDTNKTGINAPIKRAKGGNRDILPLFDTMAMRTEQTFKAIAKNNFGIELMHTLDSVVENETTNLDEVIDSFDKHDELLKEGKNGKNPTFTVFEDGKRVTFEITEDMYDALKPTSEGLKYTNKVANTVGNIFRGLLTEYNPVFMATNAVKDAQDILINSQHATKTYANIPTAIKEMASKGKWYAEYIKNGGSQNTYFDSESKTFKQENTGFKKAIGMPLRAIKEANNFIERVPRLAEYIASRKSGASIETAMLDAARVSTNFAAGGDVTKALNRNGFNFLNASMQGAMQQVRNVREAKMNGFKGWVQLAAKVAIAGLPAVLLNNLMWDDDEEYEELSDYVKQNYYVVAKFGDGKFVRIPKGRTVAVIQEAFTQMANLATGNDEVDLESFAELVISNLAPNNPLENNILAPFIQVANNETWYGEDLVPTRLQDLPAAEQYDESTDSISRWLGEKLNVSPYKLNYLFNQYSGGIGDVFLPMLTPEAESGDNSFAGNILAPFKDKFSTDSVMNNQNISDFYSTLDELTQNANSMYATEEDVLKYKYLNSVNAELGELYAQKREIQNSPLSDDVKYNRVRNIQKQIDDLAKNSLNTYNGVTIDNGYATVGDRHYRTNKDGEWEKITDKQLEKQQEVTSGLGISASEYWSNKEECDYAYENPEKYVVAKAIGGYSAYKTYSSELYDIKADKDEDGKSISGSRKEKVIEYINNLNADYGEKIILFKSQYNADDTYNYEIIEYLNSREDISYEEMETILKELGFTVLADGTVKW